MGSSTKPKILFGPFIGELGWEQSFFAGYARRGISELSGPFDVHIASYPGRRPLYGPGATVHAHPEWFTAIPISHNAYIADQWRGRWPRASDPEPFAQDIQEQYERLKAHYLAELGPIHRVLAPADLFRCIFSPQQVWGTFIPPLAPLTPAAFTRPISPSVQRWEKLPPDERAAALVSRRVPELADPARPVVSVFPRRRLGRRPDKNWPEDRYRELIERLLQHAARPVVLVVGAPGGCYFDDAPVPTHAVDLIRVPEASRFELHVGAAQRSLFATGGLSGALLTMLGLGVPVIEWGYRLHEPETRRQNFMRTPLHYIASNMPTLDQVWQAVDAALVRGTVQDATVELEGAESHVQELSAIAGGHLALAARRALKMADAACFSVASRFVGK